MGKGKIEAMATKFSEKFAIIVLKKYRKFCGRGFTYLDATPIVQIHMRHPVGRVLIDCPQCINIFQGPISPICLSSVWLQWYENYL